MFRLSGRAHAGSKGDRTAVIRASQLDTHDISIGDIDAAAHLTLEQASLIICNSLGVLELRPQLGSMVRSSEGNIIGSKVAPGSQTQGGPEEAIEPGIDGWSEAGDHRDSAEGSGAIESLQCPVSPSEITSRVFETSCYSTLHAHVWYSSDLPLS